MTFIDVPPNQIDGTGHDPILEILANGAGTEKVRITAAGNVGIGTTSPATALNVNGSVLINATSQDAVPGNLEVHGTIRLLGAGGGAVTQVEYGANGASDGLDFIPRNYDSHHIRFDANGKVGIGTTSPQSQLDVSGGISAGSYAGSTAAPSNGLILDGKVGMGANSPSAQLHIASSGGSTDQLYLQNTYSGGATFSISVGHYPVQ